MNFGSEQNADDISKSISKTPDINLLVQQVFQNMKEMVFGAGTTVIKGNKEGFFMGGVNFSTAKFSVNYLGAVNSLSTFTSGASGTSQVVIDGVNNAIFFYNDAGTLAATLANYATGGVGAKSVGLDAVSGGEVKLTVGSATRLVAKTVSGNAVIEFFIPGHQIYSIAARPLAFTTDISPLTTGGNHLGTSTYRWGELHVNTIYIGTGNDEGITDSFGYTDDNGAKKVFEFIKGVLTDQHA